MGPPKRRSKATWGRYLDPRKGDVSFFDAQKASRAKKLKEEVTNDCN